MFYGLRQAWAGFTQLADSHAGHGPFRARSHAELIALLDGWALEPPGLVPVVDWHPERAPQPQITAEEAVAYGGIATRQATTPSIKDSPGAQRAGADNDLQENVHHHEQVGHEHGRASEPRLGRYPAGAVTATEELLRAMLRVLGTSHSETMKPTQSGRVEGASR